MIDNKTASHIAGLARFAAMDAMYKQAQQPVAPGSLGKNLGNYGVKSRAPDKGYVYPPAAPSQRSLPPFKAGVGGAAAAAAGASGLSGQAIRGGLGALGGEWGKFFSNPDKDIRFGSAGQQSMTNPTPTGDLPNFYDQEMYELNRPENQATFPNYSSGSSLKPEIQAGFPEEWFGSPGFHGSRVPIYGGWATDGVGDPRWRSRMQGPEGDPVPPDPGWMGPSIDPDTGTHYINPGKREGDPAAGFKDLLPDLGGGLEPPSPYSRQPLGSAPPGR